MATISAPSREHRIVFHDITWDVYQSLVAARGDGRVLITYDQGTLELMSSSQLHARLARLINRLILIITEEFNIAMSSAGSTTWSREDLERGLEPDDCYYIQNEPATRGKDEMDLSVDPPPDLAVEVEVSRNAVNRMPIYAALGVLEVWRFDGIALRVFELTDSGYEERDQSVVFPFLPLQEVVRVINERTLTDETTWARNARSWVRTLLPAA